MHAGNCRLHRYRFTVDYITGYWQQVGVLGYLLKFLECLGVLYSIFRITALKTVYFTVS